MRRGQARRATVALAILAVGTAALVGVKAFSANAVSTSDCATVSACIDHARADLDRAAGFTTTIATTTIAPTTTPTTTVPATTTTKPVTLGICPTSDTASTYSGTRLTFTQAAEAGYAAGFTTQTPLETMVAIGSAESSLDVRARNWHPEYGCRPASDVLGVVGPTSVWDSTHARQLHSDRGTWQVSSHSWPQFADACADDPPCAARAFRTIYDTGRGFVEWDTYNSGAYKARLTTELRNAVAAVIAAH